VRGCFVTGTDTGVGKTVLAAAICAALRARGERVAAVKPVVTGLDEIGTGEADHELLARAAEIGDPGAVTRHGFGPALSPHLAARLAGVELDPAALVADACAAAAGADLLVAEGVGGLLVPLTDTYLVRDYAVDLGLPVVIAARPGLGTINHTLLTLAAARAAGLTVLGVVLTPWPDEPDAMEQSNRETIAALGETDVATLPQTALDPQSLAAAGAGLPLDAWLPSVGRPAP
jgi:dethiobiotin synthetase